MTDEELVYPMGRTTRNVEMRFFYVLTVEKKTVGDFGGVMYERNTFSDSFTVAAEEPISRKELYDAVMANAHNEMNADGRDELVVLFFHCGPDDV